MYIAMYNLDMAQRYTISEARANLPSIVDAAEGGASIELTRRGKPVAVVISRQELERLRAGRPTFAEAYAKFRESHPPDPASAIETSFWNELRDRSPGREVDL